MSVATVMTAAVIFIGYRIGRAHAAWRDFRAVQRDLPAKRRTAWRHIRPLFFGALLLIFTFVAAAYNAGH